jgi:AcrR family transcriptional regulator
MHDSKDLWVHVGYEAFALAGPNALKVEKLARKVGISKSSFYHHFADTEGFMAHLLAHHLLQSQVIAAKENGSKSIDPELVDVLADHKIDLLFNRQLRIHRDNKACQEALTRSTEIVGNAFVPVWVRELNLHLSPPQLEALFSLALDNFYLRLTPETLTRDWLVAYFRELKHIAGSFRQG